MARALFRSELASALRGRSPAAGAVQRAFSAESSHSHDVEETIRWRNITAVAYVACIGLGIYQFSTMKHHEHHERPAYSYLRIRNKEFPWGPCGLFELDCKK